MSVNSGIPSNEKDAMKLGRGGKFASPGAPVELAEIQNQVARSYHEGLAKAKSLSEDVHCLCSL